MIASDLVTSSLLLLGVIAGNEVPSAEESTNGLTALQQLLDDWSADELIVFATRTAAITIGVGTNSYPIPGARPVKILSADTVVGLLTQPVQVVGPDAWAAIDDRSATSAKAKYVYCDYGYPTPTVYVSPTPAAFGTLNLYCMVDLATVASGGSTFAMPEAYARGIRFNLALDLAGEYGRTAAPEIVKGAADSKATLMKLVASNRAGKSELALPPVPGT